MHNKDIVYVELVLCYLAEAYALASGKQVSAIFQVIHSQTVRQSLAHYQPSDCLRLLYLWLYSRTVCELNRLKG